jgi:hypothetical protein
MLKYLMDGEQLAVLRPFGAQFNNSIFSNKK